VGPLINAGVFTETVTTNFYSLISSLIHPLHPMFIIRHASYLLSVTNIKRKRHQIEKLYILKRALSSVILNRLHGVISIAVRTSNPTYFENLIDSLQKHTFPLRHLCVKMNINEYKAHFSTSVIQLYLMLGFKEYGSIITLVGEIY
jgi:hypothetical protein